METNRLKQFRALVETGNLRKAAELLNISHSGLSKSMRAFEVEVGKKLFLQSGRGLVTTDEGAKLYERSQRFLEELDSLLDHSTHAPRELVRLGAFEVFTTHFIGI